VISAVVAPSRDADATRVEIEVDTRAKRITIMDDGRGMTREDINAKYLKVGYRKRDNEPTKTTRGRNVMGRKGIGKLSLFSIAQTIEVHSVKGGEKSGFIMETAAIEKATKSKMPYYPKPVGAAQIEIKKGTKIALRNLKKGVETTASFLRKRLARRFSIIGEEQGFTVAVNGDPITIEDRDYFNKIEYLWTIGETGQPYSTFCKNAKKTTKLSGVVDAENGYEVNGWVGTFDEQKSIDEGNNTIAILAWGKLIHEDLLKDVKEGGVFTKYLMGELRADFLDLTEKDDIATSGRQNLRETDPRYIKLRAFVQEKILKTIQNNWRDWRNEDAEGKALENPKVKEWFDQLGPGNKKYARKLFAKIESFPIQDSSYKKELYKHGILAFETLALRDNLGALDNVETTEDFELLKSIFGDMDELEAVHYWQITKTRVEVLKKFEGIVPDSKEKLIQTYIFDHLWLLHPSWERASTDARMEQAVTKEWKGIDAKLTADEKSGRLDIRYRTAAGKHIIIELKKYKRKVSATDLVNQSRKYSNALEKCLVKAQPGRRHVIECICVVGSPPEPVDDDERNRKLLEAVGARYITYDQLIQETRESYRDYLEKEKVISRIQDLIENL
jgi:histidine kinase/DNA gyrase B/HSP90-like ATPase